MATLVLFGRMLLALSVVLVLIYGFSRLARRSHRRERLFGSNGVRIEVVARKSLSRTNNLILVRAEGRKLLVGTTSQSVSLICDLTDEGDSDESATLESDVLTNRNTFRSISGPPRTAVLGDSGTPTAWDALVNALRERTVRR